jgi:DNA repair exonuclease SbcCD ATPase subunit
LVAKGPGCHQLIADNGVAETLASYTDPILLILHSRQRICRRALWHCKAARAERRRLRRQLRAGRKAFQQLSKKEQQEEQQLSEASGSLAKLSSERDKLQQQLVAVEGKLAAAEGRLIKVEALVPRLEERCNGLTADKRKLSDRATQLAAQVASLEGKAQVRPAAHILQALMHKYAHAVQYMQRMLWCSALRSGAAVRHAASSCRLDFVLRLVTCLHTEVVLGSQPVLLLQHTGGQHPPQPAARPPRCCT